MEMEPWPTVSLQEAGWWLLLGPLALTVLLLGTGALPCVPRWRPKGWSPDCLSQSHLGP